MDLNKPVYVMASEIARHSGYDLSEKDKEAIDKGFKDSGGSDEKLLLGSIPTISKLRVAIVNQIQEIEKNKKQAQTNIFNFDWVSTRIKLNSLKIASRILKNKLKNIK